MRYEADVIVDSLTGTAMKMCTSSKGEKIERETQKRERAKRSFDL